MSWYQAPGQQRRHVGDCSNYGQSRTSAELSATISPAFMPLQSEFILHPRTDSRCPTSSGEDYCGATNVRGTESIPLPESAGGWDNKSNKRPVAEIDYAAEYKRPRFYETTAPIRIVPQYPIHPNPKTSHVVHSGTQHNPVEIESSPEPDCRISLPGREAYIMAKKRSDEHRSSLMNNSQISKPEHAEGKRKYYAVPGGHNPGVYTEWSAVEEQIRGFSGAKHKKFATESEAWDYMEQHVFHVQFALDRRNARSTEQSSVAIRTMLPFPPTLGDSKHTAPSLMHHVPTHHYGHSGPSAFSHRLHEASSALVSETFEKDNISSEPEPVLSPEQQQVVDLILEGHNVFYTGSAGCGKSTILKAFVKQLQVRGKRVKIVAPTNLAALNVNGQTTWNYAGWTPDSMKKSLETLMNAAHGTEVWTRFDSTDVLVLDEISMVENLMFERLNHIMKASRGEKYGGGPFGGVQLIVTGDFCQLAPVKPFQHCIGCGWELIPDNKQRPTQYHCENRKCREDVFYHVDKWAFRSKAWEECNFKHINLTEIHRQNDKKFISILQRIRIEGDILPNHAHILLNHTSETENAIKLFSLRMDVDRVNNENIAKLPSEPHRYKCADRFRWNEHHRGDQSLEKNAREANDGSGTLQALKDHRYEINVQLKEGQRVVLQANLDPPGGLVNGSQGSVIGFEPFDPKRLPRKIDEQRADMVLPGVRHLRGEHAKYQEEEIKAFADSNGQKPWPIVRFDNGKTKTIYAECTVNELGNEQPYSLLSRTQIPLMAGYAITVHKSQGMTLDRVIVDLRRAFEPSQIYVALSRARSLQGLKVIGLPTRHLGGANVQVKEFMSSISKKH